MFFLFGISCIILLVRLYNHLHEQVKELASSDTLANMSMRAFLLFTKIQSHLSQTYDMYYENHGFFRDSINYLHIGYNHVITHIYNCKKEPVDANWINTILLYRNNNDCSRKIVPKLIENYDIVHNYNYLYLTTMVFHRKMMYFNHADEIYIPSTNVMTMYLMKYHDKYLCKHHYYGMFQQWSSEMKNVNNPFFEVEYTDKETGFTCIIDIPKNYFIEDNELLSFVFLKRWFEYSYVDGEFVFNEDYIINITDDSFDTFTLTRYEYILLNDKGYSIEKIK